MCDVHIVYRYIRIEDKFNGMMSKTTPISAIHNPVSFTRRVGRPSGLRWRAAELIVKKGKVKR